jgi:hypothetical protein
VRPSATSEPPTALLPRLPTALLPRRSSLLQRTGPLADRVHGGPMPMCSVTKWSTAVQGVGRPLPTLLHGWPAAADCPAAVGRECSRDAPPTHSIALLAVPGHAASDAVAMQWPGPPAPPQPPSQPRPQPRQSPPLRCWLAPAEQSAHPGLQPPLDLLVLLPALLVPRPRRHLQGQAHTPVSHTMQQTARLWRTTGMWHASSPRRLRYGLPLGRAVRDGGAG